MSFANDSSVLLFWSRANVQLESTRSSEGGFLWESCRIFFFITFLQECMQFHLYQWFEYFDNWC